MPAVFETALHRRGLAAVPAIAIVLAGCGSTIDPSSGENLIRNFIKRSPAVTLKSVSCPSGVKPKDGTTFDCRVSVTDSRTRAVHSGTITVHVTGSGKKIEILGGQDIHIR
jgi:hypothetical protein